MVVNFSESFWNEDIGSYEGFEAVVNRLKAGRTVIKQYAEYLKQRSLIEETLGKSLLKLSKSMAMPGEDVGFLNDAWETMRLHTEMSALGHLESAQQFSDESVFIAETNVKFREERKGREERVRSCQQKLKSDWRRVSDCRRAHEARCNDEILSNQQYHTEAVKKGRSSREAERAAAKHDKSRTALRQSDSVYQSSVAEAEESRQEWERETENCLSLFQDLEEGRIALLRDSLWKVTNIVSSHSVVDDRGSEQVRVALERGELTECLEGFVAENATGSRRPEPIVYENMPTSDSDGLGKASQMPQMPTISSKVQVVNTGSMTRANNANGFSPTPIPIPIPTMSMAAFSNSTAAVSSYARSVHVPTTNTTHLGGVNGGPSSRTNTMIHTPKKPPRLIHYASQSAINHTKRETGKFPIVDSVDNIEYFNLSETTSSDCPSDNSTGMSGGGGGGVAGYYGGSLKDFGWSYDAGEKVVW